MGRARLLALVGLLLSCALRVHAQDNQDDAAGWGATASPSPAQPALPEEGQAIETPGPTKTAGRDVRLSLLGFTAEDVGFAPERTRPFVLARSTLEIAAEASAQGYLLHLGVHAEGDPVYWVKDETDRPTRDAYAYRVVPWECYLALRSSELSLSMGRQIVVWGDSQLLRALDLPNPRDLRMPGLGELGGEHIPLTMTVLRFDHGAHRAELMAIHEVDYTFQPPPFGVYSPLAGILKQGDGVRQSGFLQAVSSREVAYDHDVKRFSRRSQQALARYRYVGSGAELGLHAAYLPYLDGALSLPTVTQERAPLKLPVAHPHYTALGASTLIARGDFVAFADVLVELRRPVSVGNLDALPFEVQVMRQDWARYVVGVRYSGIEDGFVALEHGLGHVLAESDRKGGLAPLLPVAPAAVAVTYQQRLFHDQLATELTASVFGPRLRGGRTARARLTYRARDGLRVSLAYALFSPDKEASPISGWTRHDRIDLSVRWDFAVAREVPSE